MLHAQTAIRNVKLTIMCVSVSQVSDTLEATSQDHVPLRLELDALHVTVRRQEGVLREFLEIESNGYSALMNIRGTSYRFGINGIMADALMRDEYVGGYCIHVGKNRYQIHIDEVANDKRLGNRHSCHIIYDIDIVEVVFFLLFPVKCP